jgi:hypothetical protein
MRIYTYVFTSAFAITRFRTYKCLFFLSGISSILYVESPYFHVSLRILLLSTLLQENKIKF